VDVTGTGFRPDIHGTLLAGIIASDPKSAAGIAGIAQQSEIVAIEACRPSDAQAVQAECWSLTLAKGLDLAIQKKVRIINMSLGGPSEKLVTRLVDEAVNRGIVVVAAAGNSGPRGQPSYPAALPNVIAVTAVDANEKLYPQATQGDFIDLAAPGVEIVSTGPGARLLISSGTSLATAFVTGVAALIVEQQPQLSPQAIQALMERTAKDLGPPGKDTQFGSGLIDACKAIAQLTSDQRLCL
jgi:subtilisin family serine protease